MRRGTAGVWCCDNENKLIHGHHHAEEIPALETIVLESERKQWVCNAGADAGA